MAFKIDIFKKVSEIRSKKNNRLHFIRYSIFSYNGVGLFIHYFTTEDREAHCHDHPWNLLVFILKGGYVEEVSNTYIKRTPLSFIRIKATHLHRVHKLLNGSCITLVFLGRRLRDWGYDVDGKWIDHKTYRELKRSGEFDQGE